jgi:Predicted hydrolase of the alpha/beta-hydrolase fold
VGFPTSYRNREFLEGCGRDKIFIQSTHDEHGPRAELEPMVNALTEPKRLIWIEAQDHFFKDALEALEDSVAGIA